MIIAAVGGVPGIIGIINLYKKSSIKIDFDDKNSMVCIIDTKTNLRNKLAVLLYSITITGKGVQPSYIAEILVAVRKEKQWVQGKRFIPSQSDKKDPNEITKKAVHLRFERPREETDNIYIASWNDFAPGQIGLKYGEPVIFSAGFYFDLERQDLEKIDKLKIIVTDYIGNTYKKIFDADFVIKKSQNFYLVQD